MSGQAETISSSGERILFQLKSRGAQSAIDIASGLGMTPTGARQHIAKLQAASLVEAEIRHQKRGRPKAFWRLTDKGHGRFPDRHSDLTLDMLRSTEAVFGKEGLERLIQHRERESLAVYQQRIAGKNSLRARLAALADIRTREGYMARFTEDEDGTFLFVEDHCPICAAATTCQLLCRSELAIFQAVLGENVRIERVDHILAGARRCAYRLSVPDR